MLVPILTGSGYLLTVRLLERLQPDASNGFVRTAGPAGQPDFSLQGSSPTE
jgi:hypothetical protein